MQLAEERYYRDPKVKKTVLKEPQTISIYWFDLLCNHVDTSTKSK